MAGVITILGCGSSGGVPRVGQGWGACDPAEPRNRRRRCSILIETAGAEPTTVLVDTSPDLREQLIGEDVRRLDGVVLTHDHADHTHGIDDLRPLTIVQRQRLDVFADTATAQTMRDRFSYCFATPPGGSYPPILRLHPVEIGARFAVQGRAGAVMFDTFPLAHGDVTVMGLRLGDVAYTPDVAHIDDISVPYLENLDLWIIDALRHTPHPTHFSLSEALAWIERMKPKRAVLTNLHTDLDYRTLAGSLPPHIEPAYDGMRLAF